MKRRRVDEKAQTAQIRQNLKSLYENPPTFDCPPLTFGRFQDFEPWKLVSNVVLAESAALEKKRQRLLSDLKYHSYDRGIEQLKEELMIVDPHSPAEKEK